MYRLEEHTRPVAGLRQVDVSCRGCSALRTLWFRLVPPTDDGTSTSAN